MSLRGLKAVSRRPIAHDHLQIVLVHPRHRLRRGYRGAGGSIPLGDVGQRQAHIDVPGAQARQVLDSALGGKTSTVMSG